MISPRDRAVLRELAKKQAEIAALDVNRERKRRIREMHALKPIRPPVWIDEIPWFEMDIDGELALRCESKEGRALEQHFRCVLFRWKYFQADMVVEDTFYVGKACAVSGIGLEVREQTLATDARNGIVSHHYEDLLDTEDKVEALLLPQVRADPEADKRNLEMTRELLDGIMPVALRGHGVYYAPWDQIARYRGVENCLVDMVERPEFIHKIMEKFTEIYRSQYMQMEALGLLDFNLSSLHCTPPYTDECPAKDYAGGPARLKDIWFRGMAQLFSAASPAMQDEFDLQYMKPFMEKCALSYYGCCEPLDKFIPWLKKISNMRKIGVSPWADVRSSAEQIGGDYVLARKPNPAHVAGVFDEERVRKEIKETVEACRENNCPYEFVLKDISTVTYRPRNLIAWTKTVMEVIDQYY
jgi:hypothetical protein